MTQHETPLLALQAQGEVATRNRHIFELTGIHPDPRSKVSGEDVRQMIIGAQEGNLDDTKSLIATRLAWIHDSYAQKDTVQDRSDLTLADVLYVGSLATIKAAQKMNSRSPVIAVWFHSKVPQLMDEMIREGKHLFEIPDAMKQLMEGGKLQPSMADDGSSPLYTTAENQQEELAATSATLVGLDVKITPLDGTEAGMTKGELRALLQSLSERERYVLELRFGLDGLGARHYKDIAVSLGVTTKQRVEQISNGALEKLRLRYQEPAEQPLPHIPPTPEQLRLREQWLEEIEAKQDAGKAAFVTGSLLKHALPGPVRYYLQRGHFRSRTGAIGLKLAQQAARREQYWLGRIENQRPAYYGRSRQEDRTRTDRVDF